MVFEGKVGCEVECIIKKVDKPKIMALCKKAEWIVGYDGSIRNYDFSTEESIELKSFVYKTSDIKKMITFVKKLSPLIRVNKTCGLHIHISFENILNYHKVLKYEFVKYFQGVIETAFTTLEEKSRLQNDFCKFYTDESHFDKVSTIQLKNFHKSERYYAINYNAYNLYKTIEFRIFPATTDITTFEKYLSLATNKVTEYLDTSKIMPIKINFTNKVKKRLDNQPVVISEVITNKEKAIMEELIKSNKKANG